VKYTVPPETLAPVPVVGDVRPGPVVGTLEGALPPLLLPLELELLFELEPQALTTNATSAAVQTASAGRENFLMLT
jgi:hypothetical protein